MSNDESGVLTMSALPKTWLLDLDGTLVKHNGYKTDGRDSFLPGAHDFLRSIPDGDMVVFVTSRTREQSDFTESFLRKHNVRFDEIIYNVPYGERILINDCKTGGLKTAYAVNVKRDEFSPPKIAVDEKL